MTRLITSQHYLSEEIVAGKIAAADFSILVSPAFEIDGESFQVVLDGHHSLSAAIEAGAEPEITIASSTEHDAVSLIERGAVEDFLEAVWMDGEYIDAATRNPIW